MSNEKKTKWELLAEPIPFQWRIISFNKEKTKGTCAGYIDARDVMDILDRVIGPENWTKRTEQFGATSTVCRIGIRTSSGDFVWKDDIGVESDVESEKGGASDAFKRAAVNWGIGRFLYSMKMKYVNVNQYGKPVDDRGEIIWDLTEHFNGKKTTPAKVTVAATKTTTTVTTKKEELPWLTEIQYEAMLKFIKEGKQEVVKNQMTKYRMKKVFRETLNKQLEPQTA